MRVGAARLSWLRFYGRRLRLGLDLERAEARELVPVAGVEPEEKERLAHEPDVDEAREPEPASDGHRLVPDVRRRDFRGDTAAHVDLLDEMRVDAHDLEVRCV